jgi:hypothetical protein
MEVVLKDGSFDAAMAAVNSMLSTADKYPGPLSYFAILDHRAKRLRLSCGLDGYIQLRMNSPYKFSHAVHYTVMAIAVVVMVAVSLLARYA